MHAPDYNLASAAKAVADPVRAAMLLRLMDGQAHTARDLANAAGVRPSAATSHLRHLLDAGFISVNIVGRQKQHRLASAEVATAIEALAAVAPLLPVESLRDAQRGARLQVARACYSHLGGHLSIAIADRLVTGRVIDPLAAGSTGSVSAFDHPLLVHLGIASLPSGSGPAVRGCLDWTESAPHLAGRLGSALLAALLEQGWLARRATDRALTITSVGETHLSALGIHLPPRV
ncbi:ArsR/SmtB family transcription factor [Dactylosporangium sp. CA-092794]|uniref:ArsR/SmtB family transcription factor n=1 Tax=Dactylosporangium sp. CA-092794 TaxID=3239929 RepID=UPI003D945DA9